MKAKGFTTYGSVRGCCGHLHKTIAAAETCLQRDQNGCGGQGGYSDREVVEVGEDDRLYRDAASDDWIPGSGGRTSGAARF